MTALHHHQVHRDLVYSPDHGLGLDLYLSPDPGNSPLVIYAHGGGFARGSKADGGATRLANLARLGLNVASIEYRLSPAVRYPEAISDTLAAAQFLREHAAEYGAPAERIGAIGASAGGYLVTMAAITGGGIDAVSPWFAPLDLWSTSRRSPLEQELMPVGFELNLLNDLDPELLRAASPVNQDLSAAPPFLLVHGDRDRIVHPNQSSFLHEALLRVGRESTLVLVGGAGHEDPRFDAGVHPAMIAAWFRATLA